MEGSIMLYLIILSTLSSDSKRRGSLVRAQGRCNGGRGRAYVVHFQESGAKNSLQPVRYYKDKTKQTSATFFLWRRDERHDVDDRQKPTRPGRVPRRVQVRTHLTLGMRAHWGCGHTGDARRRARARGNRVVFCGHAQRNNRRHLNRNQAIDSVCSGACEASSS